MAISYLDQAVSRRLDGWHSPTLDLPMPVVTYGHGGRPLLLFPTAAADFLENERFFLVKSIEPAIMAGRFSFRGSAPRREDPHVQVVVVVRDHLHDLPRAA